MESGGEDKISIYNPGCPESAEPLDCSGGWRYFDGKDWTQEGGISLTCLTGKNTFLHLIINIRGYLYQTFKSTYGFNLRVAIC